MPNLRGSHQIRAKASSLSESRDVVLLGKYLYLRFFFFIILWLPFHLKRIIDGFQIGGSNEVFGQELAHLESAKIQSVSWHKLALDMLPSLIDGNSNALLVSQ